MPSQKLTDILKTFDKQDWRAFERFVASPFFNRNERLVSFVDLLRKHAPDFDENKLTKEKVFESLYDKKTAYKEQQVYDHIAFLMRLIEQFLAYQEYEQEEPMQERYLLSACVKRNLTDHFGRYYKKTRAKHLKKKYRNKQFHLSRFFADREANQLAILTHQPDYIEITGRMVTHLDRFYLASKLEYGCSLRIMRQMWKHQPEHVFLNELVSFLENDGSMYLEDPLIKVYFHTYKILDPDVKSEDSYQTLIDILTHETDVFTKEETYGLYIYAQNYVTSQLNTGASSYLTEIFRLYKEMLEKEVFLFNGYLDGGVYKNIVTVGLRLNQFDWVESFLHKYQKFLHPSHQNPAFHYNVAAYYYALGEYSKALRELLQTDLIDVYYHLNVRQMQLKIYFEQKEDDALNSLMDAFSSYLKRNKQVSDSKLQAYRNLVRFIRKAARLRQRGFTLKEEVFDQQKASLLEEIATAPNLPNRDWLRERVGQFSV